MMKIHLNENDNLLPVLKNREGECVTVFFTPFKIGEVRNFRCISCGKLLFQYECEISLIIDSSDSPKEKGTINHLCQRCKLMFRCLW